MIPNKFPAALIICALMFCITALAITDTLTLSLTIFLTVVALCGFAASLSTYAGPTPKKPTP